jgi:hypothetical protein
MPLGHAYTIQGVEERKRTDGTIAKLFKIKNPHGYDNNFTGRWRDDIDDGYYFLEIDEVRKALFGVEVNHLGFSNLKYSYYSAESGKEHNNQFYFKLAASQEVII